MTGGGIVSTDSSRPRLPSPGRLGLLDDRAADWLDYLGWTDDDAVPVLWSLSRAPDPDLALGALVRLHESLTAESHDEGTSARAGGDTGVAALDAALRSDSRLRARLLGLLGSSSALGDHLVAEPTRWALLRGGLPTFEDVLADMLGAVEAV
ncbi:bifunctional [glutamine synthetase] adenylyltransferase/[glutamine synthetase]-adenylyl-L-tyrosine phosphorylase, partial [Dietzia kunjamensis]|nr:bifunctional [glutamine synthetase] adenylyltransferase/[glutamine synthetase]-adenylyl-L-tyrosine phosphorylase [Dietzia kunjamensis]